MLSFLNLIEHNFGFYMNVKMTHLLNHMFKNIVKNYRKYNNTFLWNIWQQNQ